MDRFANEINNLYTTTGIQQGEYPVPLVRIANALGYTVSTFNPTFETLAISGAVLYDKKLILLNSTELNIRQNFTLAHEIGHIVLEHRNNGAIIDKREDILSPSLNSAEWDANEFAAELLMPEQEFQRKWSSSNRSIEETARYFQTSYSSTELRAKRLEL